jgi:signal transduction histidine kinase
MPPRPRVPAWLRWPRRTARLRFTAVYAGLFLLSGAALVATTYILFQHATQYTEPHLPDIPHTPAIQALQLPGAQALFKASGVSSMPSGGSQLLQDQNQLAHDQDQLAQAQHQLTIHSVPTAPQGTAGLVPGGRFVPQLTQDQRQLTQDQRQLTAAVDQLAQAVHQVAQAGTVQAAQRASDSHQLLVNSGIALAIVAVLALLAGWLVAGRMLRPVRVITATARRISSTNLRQRLALDRADEEFKRLGDTLDDLFARLAAAFEAKRHFVANASHELRTPLTAERNLLQVALDDPRTSAAAWRYTARELLASNDEQKHLIEALLTLASSESGLDHRERTDLARICQSVLPRPGLDTDRLEVHIDTAIHPAPLDGDPRLIECLVTNLVDNAIGHNLPCGLVHVRTDTAAGKAVLSVTNTGPIIPPTAVDRLFQPFQRLDPRRTHHNSGHGLGLSIVQAIATTHHATIAAHPRPDGGLSVTVSFPPLTSSNTTSRTPRIAAHCP